MRKPCRPPKTFVLWLTGLPSSGKTTLARGLKKQLTAKKIPTSVLDGDILRKGPNKDLGFSKRDRLENIRRAGRVAKRLYDSDRVVIASFISPYAQSRRRVRRLFPVGHFFEIFLNCPKRVCRQRDPKGLYRKAQQKRIPYFTGVSAPYEKPQRPELTLNTALRTRRQCVSIVLRALAQKGMLHGSSR